MHSKCQEMTTDCMCSFILPSQPGLLYVPAAYGELLRADQRHILTQDRFDWNLYDNNFLFNLRETQSDGMRQRGKTGASISFFHHTVLVGRRFLSVSVSVHPRAEWIATNSAQAPLIPKKFFFPPPGALAVFAPPGKPLSEHQASSSVACPLSSLPCPWHWEFLAPGSVGKDLVPLYRQCSLAWLFLFLRRT